MSMTTTQVFGEMADALVGYFDVVDLLTKLCDDVVVLFDIDAAGVLIRDAEGTLRVIAASSEQTRLIELFQLQNDEGPCLESSDTGYEVTHTHLRDALERWPQFAPYAVGAGFEAVFALPLRFRGRTFGALNMFRHEPGDIPASDIRSASSLAGLAIIAIVAHDADLRAGQLQTALDSRVAIEQVKGMIHERANVDMDAAFQILRAYTRRRSRPMSEVAADVVDGRLSLEAILS